MLHLGTAIDLKILSQRDDGTGGSIEIPILTTGEIDTALTAGGGNGKFEVSRAVLQEIAENHKRFNKPVPVGFLGHNEDRSGPQPAFVDALRVGGDVLYATLSVNTWAWAMVVTDRASLKRIALSLPDVAFSLQHNGKTIWQLPATPPGLPLSGEETSVRAGALNRISAILGEEFGHAAIGVQRQAASLTLQGLAALPAYSRSSRDAQYFFVNGRFVRDKVASHALRQAYQDILHHQRHPAFVLFLEIPPHQVDVNVHPAKSEVRFRESQGIHQFIFHTLQQALSAPMGNDASTIPPPTPPLKGGAHAALTLPFKGRAGAGMGR